MIDAVMKSQNKVFTQKTKKEFSKSKLWTHLHRCRNETKVIIQLICHTYNFFFGEKTDVVIFFFRNSFNIWHQWQETLPVELIRTHNCDTTNTVI